MKELTIEEKLEEAKMLYKDANADQRYVLESLFPELAEIEDVKIRKELIKFVKSRLAGFPQCEKFVAWLEKQAETFTKKDVDDAYLKGISDAKQELEKQSEQKPVDKVEPKFHEGDIIKPKDGGHEPWQIMQVDISDKKYRFKDGYVIHFSQEDDYELVEQKNTWTKEDNEMLDSIIEEVRYMGDFPDYPTKEEDELYDECLVKVDWLKSLKERYAWRPSEEMLEALYRVIPENTMEISEDEMLLDKLYQGLKYGRVLSKK